MKTFLYGGRILRGGSLGHVEQTIDDPGQWKRFYPDVKDRIPPDKGIPNELKELKEFIGQGEVYVDKNYTNFRKRNLRLIV